MCGKSGMARMLSEMYATLGSPFLAADILISLPNANFALRIQEEEGYAGGGKAYIYRSNPYNPMKRIYIRVYRNMLLGHHKWIHFKTLENIHLDFKSTNLDSHVPDCKLFLCSRNYYFSFLKLYV